MNQKYANANDSRFSKLEMLSFLFQELTESADNEDDDFVSKLSIALWYMQYHAQKIFHYGTKLQ